MTNHNHDKKEKKILNLPSVDLPVKPLTMRELDASIQHTIDSVNEEFEQGFNFIKKHPKSVTFFGSARLKEDNRYYQKAMRLGERLANMGYSVVSGGGPGIMEAANRGAFVAGGQSLGLTIELPEEQNVNPYVTDYVDFYYFFTRKVILTFSAESYVYFPGGYGTLDEFFEIMTLVQTNKIAKVPIILVGAEFWNPVNELIEKHLYEEFHTVGQYDSGLYQILDDEDEMIDIIKSQPIKRGD